MSVNPSQSWVSPNTALFGAGGAGGSNFPNGITIGSNSLNIQQGNVGSNAVVFVSDISGINTGFLANPIYSGDVATSYLVFGSTTIGCLKGDGSASANLLTSVNVTDTTNAFNLGSINSLTGVLNTTASNAGFNPIDFTIRPDQASKGGIIYGKLEYDAVDTGANYALVFGASNANSFITSVWPGYISMPLQLTGATLEMASDNETFLYMDGKAGALGSISTGTPFLSGSNLFSSITEPTETYKADMTALLSTLASVYPACFS